MHILISPEAAFTDDAADIIGIPLDGVMAVHLQAQLFQLVLEGLHHRLAGVAGDDHRADEQAEAPEGVDEPQHILVIGDAQVAPDLVFHDVAGVDGDDDLGLVCQGLEHLDLAVRRKARQHAARVIIVKQLAAQLQIQLLTEQSDPFPDMRRLHFNVFGVVKSDFLCHFPFCDHTFYET